MLFKDTIARYYKLLDFQRYLVNRYIMRKFAGGLTCFDDENAIAVPDDFRKSIKFTCDLCGGYPIQLIDTSKGISVGGEKEATNEFTQVVLRAETIKSYEDFEEIIKRDVAAEVKEDAKRAIERTKVEEQAKSAAAMRAKQAAEAIAATEAQRRAEALRAKELYEQQMRRAEQGRMQAEQFAVATEQARKKAEQREYYLHTAVQQALGETENNFKQERAKWKKERQGLQKQALKVIVPTIAAVVLIFVILILAIVVPALQPVPQNVSIYFNPNGGVLVPNAMVQSGKAGEALTRPIPSVPATGPFSDGYRFAGWCLTASNGNGTGNPVTWTSFPADKSLSHVLHAKWEADPEGCSVLSAKLSHISFYTLTDNKIDNVVIEKRAIFMRLSQSDSVYSTTSDSLTADFEFSPNYREVRVYRDSACNILAPAAFSLNEGVNIVFLWVRASDGVAHKTYMLTIIRNTVVEVEFKDGINVHTSIPVVNGGLVTEPVPPTKEGYSFFKWTYNEGELGNNVDFSVFRPQINTTLYARYTANAHRILLDANADRYREEYPGFLAIGNPARLSVLTDARVTLTLSQSAYTADGYHFMGWATSKFGEIAFTDGAELTYSRETLGNAFIGSGNLTLYAVWRKN